MTGYLEAIHIGVHGVSPQENRLNRRHEAEGSRLSWINNQCHLIISLDHLKPEEIRGVQRGYEGYALAVNRIFETYPTGAIGEGSRVRCKSGD